MLHQATERIYLFKQIALKTKKIKFVVQSVLLLNNVWFVYLQVNARNERSTLNIMCAWETRRLVAANYHRFVFV